MVSTIYQPQIDANFFISISHNCVPLTASTVSAFCTKRWERTSLSVRSSSLFQKHRGLAEDTAFVRSHCMVHEKGNRVVSTSTLMFHRCELLQDVLTSYDTLGTILSLSKGYRTDGLMSVLNVKCIINKEG